MSGANNKRTKSILLSMAVGVTAIVPFALNAQADSGVVVEGESMRLASNAGMVLDDSSASAGRRLLIWGNDRADANVTVPASNTITLRAKGDQCQGAPTAQILIDNQLVAKGDISSSELTDYNFRVTVAAGSHLVSVAYANDFGGPCDRNLHIDKITFSGSSAPTTTVPATTTTKPVTTTTRPTTTTTTIPVTTTTKPSGATSFQAESMNLDSSNGQVFDDGSATGGKALIIWSNGAATKTATFATAGRIVVRAKGDQCSGAPQMVIGVDGQQVGSGTVTATDWTSYGVNASVSAGTHTIAVGFVNDAMVNGCDRNLRIDSVSLEGATSPATTTTTTTTKPPATTTTTTTTRPPATTTTTTTRPAPTTTVPPVSSGNPFASSMWVDINNPAKGQADSWRSSRPADAARMDVIASQPHGVWLGAWSGDIQSAAANVMNSAGSQTPVLVAYNIPQRDCSGGYSAGGLTPDGYRTWIRGMAAGINNHKAIVILEPDALPDITCLSATDQQTRYDLMRDAVQVLSANANTAVYIDAGNSTWIPADQMAPRLQAAGIQFARGFSTNVSGYESTGPTSAFGEDLANRLGGIHYVIDTGRNGNGATADHQWCNPPGRALGSKFTTNTGLAHADAFFWVKTVGESDGTCNGGPSAGTWWPEYANDLARSAGY